MNTTNPLSAYRETQIKTANQGKLIVMLYDGAIKNINLALESLNDGHDKFDLISSRIVRAQDIITELMVSLNFDEGGDIAQNLFNLYLFMNRRLLESNMNKKNEPLTEVRQLLTELRAAWVEISQRNENEDTETGRTGVNIAG